MKITRIEITQHALPLDPPFNPSWSSRPRLKFDATIVRVHTDEGHVGVGSGDFMLGFAGHEHVFVGEDPLRLERHNKAIEHISFHYGRCWPLDLALWDLAGKIAGEPVWKLLGGRSQKLDCYASSGTLRPARAMADLAEKVLDRGFKAMKVRFRRGDWRDDIMALEAVREKVGDKLELMVDCNQGWRFPWDTMPPWSLKDASKIGRELDQLGVYWMEEPLGRSDREGMRRLREMLDVRIAGGELNREVAEFRDLLADGCLDVLQPDVVSVGGITGLKRVALMAEEHGIVFTPHTWGNGIGLMANAQLMAGVAGTSFIELPWDPPEWTAQRRDFMLTTAIEPDGQGQLIMPDTPGLGIELDEDLLERTRVEDGVVTSNN